MKSLFKYHPSLFVSLLIGYSQLYAPLASDFSVHRITSVTLHASYSDGHFKGGALQSLCVYEEREDDDERNSRKKADLSNNFFEIGDQFRCDVDFIKYSFSINHTSPPVASLRSAYLLFGVFRL